MDIVNTVSDETVNETILSTEPLVATYNNILSDEECQHFIDISRKSLKRALVSQNDKGIVSIGRTGSNTWILHDHDEITKKIGERIANLVGMPIENAEAFQVIYYDISQEYRAHYDSWLHNGSEKTLRCMKKGGARMKTALCYLNDVTKGGGTKMTKLNITVPAQKGKLLVFHNTVSEQDHTRHELSEHAGLPVEEGEKFAFNLWFKECNRSMLYKDFNPEYYKPLPTIKYNSPIKDIFKVKSYVSNTIVDTILSNCKFNTKQRPDAWVKLNKVPELVKKLEETTTIDRSFFENINVVQYNENLLHNAHFDAYDLNSEIGKKNTEKQGQRVYVISLLLTDNLEIKFDTLNSVYNLNKTDVLLYKTVLMNSFTRNQDLKRSMVCKKGTGYLANIYIRSKNNLGICLSEYTSQTDATEINDQDNVSLNIQQLENYTDTLNQVLDQFKKDAVKRSWSGLISFKYGFKGNFNVFKEYIAKYNEIRDSFDTNSCLIQENLQETYTLNDELPLQIVNNVLQPSLLKLLQDYYKETIDNKVWHLGDKQSNRYKSHNEPMSRFLHYECLPLIEKIVGKAMKPTYTYLSAYVKGAELPPHTDRADCEYTVSFIVDKPEGSTWNIYVHKPQQPVKHKGRYEVKPPLEECEAVDCDAGGLMLFQGTDHIHFREELQEEYYNILLLHYCSV
jgi:prolyl 4-hydroxylase